MEYLSWMFFCLSPFALFCSEDGNGLILCPIFIILGFVFRWIGNNGIGSKTVVKVNPQEFWEWHYLDRMKDTLAQKNTMDDYLMSTKDKEARDWATIVCGYHNCYVPSDSQQEKIARANGVVTEKMIKKRERNKDRIQIGKFFLMGELEEKYKSTRIRDNRGRRGCSPITYIKMDKDRIRTSDYGFINDYWTEKKYNMSIKEVWDDLSTEEKNKAKKWVEEYEKNLMMMVHEYVDNERACVCVKMDF